MRIALKLHPDSCCDAVAGIEAEAARAVPGMLILHYRVTGTIRDLKLPPLSAPVRTDNLWQHSCFEAFVGAAGDAAYHEFNLAPSRRWAAYAFDGYRAGMRPAEMPAPDIAVRGEDETWELRASLDLAELSALADDAPWRLGLSAVIEEASGHKSYWALAHPPGKPDFHHQDCFALQLPPAA